MAIPFLSSIDLTQNQALRLVLHNATSDPSGVEGQIYYNTGTNQAMAHNGSAFVNIGLSTEEVQDIVGAQFVTNGSHSGISFAYDDAGDGAIDATIGTLNQNTTGTAAIATTVTLTDESTDATCFPVFAQNATGNNYLETGSNLTFASNTGILTATGFSGPLTAANSVDSDQYVDRSIDTIHIGLDQIISELIADDAVDSEHIANDAINHGDLIADGVIGSEHYADGSIDYEHIQNVAANSVLVRDANSSGIVSAKALATTQLLIGDGTGFTAAALSGDVSMTNAGVVTVTQSAGNFTVTGDLIVSGDTTTVNTATLSVEDPLIVLASGNTGNLVDVGFYAKYVATGAKYTGLFRDRSDSNIWKLFATTGNSHEVPSTTVNTGSGFTLGHLELDTIEASTVTIPDNAIAVGKIAAGALPTDVKVNNDNWSGADLAVTNGGTGAGTLNNLITLTTHTTGNYVGTVTATTNGGITTTGATTGEGIAHALAVDFASAAQTITGTQYKVVTANNLSARSVSATIDIDEGTNAFIASPHKVTIAHDFATEDVMVQLFHSDTKETVYADVKRTNFAGAAATDKVTITFASVPTHNIEVLITSIKGAGAGTVTYA